MFYDLPPHRDLVCAEKKKRGRGCHWEDVYLIDVLQPRPTSNTLDTSDAE
jgi:hypothetical protein